MRGFLARLSSEFLLTFTFRLVFLAPPCIFLANLVPMATATPQTRQYWIFSADPHHYHWDTLFVKGKEMWHGAGAKADALADALASEKYLNVTC